MTHHLHGVIDQSRLQPGDSNVINEQHRQPNLVSRSSEARAAPTRTCNHCLFKCLEVKGLGVLVATHEEIFSFATHCPEWAVVSKIRPKMKTFQVQMGAERRSKEKRRGEERGASRNCQYLPEAECTSRPCLPPRAQDDQQDGTSWSLASSSLRSRLRRGLTSTKESPSSNSREAQQRGPGRWRPTPSPAPQIERNGSGQGVPQG